MKNRLYCSRKLQAQLYIYVLEKLLFYLGDLDERLTHKI